MQFGHSHVLFAIIVIVFGDEIIFVTKGAFTVWPVDILYVPFFLLASLCTFLQRSFLYCCEMVESCWEYFVLLINLVPFFFCIFVVRLVFISFCFLQWSLDWQFRYLFSANAVLEGACERAIVGELYCDIPLGLYVIRGENVVLIGELVWI